MGYQDPSVRLEKIKMYSLIKVDGYLMYLTGRTEDRLTVVNSVEMKLSNEWNAYVKRLFSYTTTVDEGSDDGVSRDLISIEKNCRLYSIIMDKYNSTIYSRRPNPIGKKLIEWQPKFKTLSLDKQIYVLRQLVQLSSNSNQGADLQYIGGKQKTGTTKFSKYIEMHKEFLLISMSPTGIYKSETNLLTI